MLAVEADSLNASGDGGCGLIADDEVFYYSIASDFEASDLVNV